jgi:hypothetical protein
MLTDANINLKRLQKLIAEGPVFASQFDSAQTQYPST